MAYYTNFTLCVYGSQKEYDLGEEYKDEERIKQIAAAIAKTDYFSWMEVEIEDLVNIYDPIDYIIGGDSHKWYEHDDDMNAISLQFPDLYFVLYGEGEEHGDIWRSFYHNGAHASTHAEIVYNEPPEDFWAEGNN